MPRTDTPRASASISGPFASLTFWAYGGRSSTSISRSTRCAIWANRATTACRPTTTSTSSSGWVRSSSGNWAARCSAARSASASSWRRRAASAATATSGATADSFSGEPCRCVTNPSSFNLATAARVSPGCAPTSWTSSSTVEPRAFSKAR